MSAERIDKRLSARIKEVLKSEHNTISVRDNVITLKRAFIEAPVDMVQYAKDLITEGFGVKYIVYAVDIGEVWPAKNAHKYVKFNLMPNNEEIEVTVRIGGPERQVKIRAYDKGGCCDPSTETYWSM